MSFVWRHSEEVSAETIMENKEFQETVRRLPNGTYVLILNQHAVNMTLNWLCNTEHFADVHSNSLVITLDNESTLAIRSAWPKITMLPLIVPALKDPFNYGEGPYQLIYLLRANLAVSFLKNGRSFWMIQQDTFWRENLSSYKSEESDSDIIFDRASANGNLIAGGYFHVRDTKQSLEYFEKLSKDLHWWYAPDNAYMTYLCSKKIAKCSHLPFGFISNWQWLAGNVDEVPSLIQFDGETKLGGKLSMMRSLGFYFLQNSSKCDSKAFQRAEQNLLQKNRRDVDMSWSRSQFSFYQSIVDAAYSNFITEYVLNNFILPYAHFCMLSM